MHAPRRMMKGDYRTVKRSEQGMFPLIIGDLQHWENESALFPPAVRRGLAYIRDCGAESLPPGKYPIEGDRMFALVQEVDTEPAERRRPEAHRSYADIQCLILGEERIGVLRRTAGLEPVEDLLEDKDIAFYAFPPERESSLAMRPGMFAVFFPNDIHRPCCQVSQSAKAKKVVVKIHRSLWEQSE